MKKLLLVDVPDDNQLLPLFIQSLENLDVIKEASFTEIIPPTDKEIEAEAIEYELYEDSERAFQDIKWWQDGAKWMLKRLGL